MAIPWSSANSVAPHVQGRHTHLSQPEIQTKKLPVTKSASLDLSLKPRELFQVHISTTEIRI